MAISACDEVPDHVESHASGLTTRPKPDRAVVDPVRAATPDRAVVPLGRIERAVHRPWVGIGAVHGHERRGDRCPPVGRGPRAVRARRARLSTARHEVPRPSVDALDPGPLRGAVPVEEGGGVPRLVGRAHEAVPLVVEVQVRIARDRVGLVDDRRVDGVQEVVALTGVTGEVHHRVGAGELEAVEVERVAGGGVGQPTAARCEGLVKVEGEERRAAAVADEHDAVEAFVRSRDPGRDVEQHLLVDQGRVVVEPTAVHVQHRDPGVEQSGGHVVMREVGARMHEDRRPSTRHHARRATPGRGRGPAVSRTSGVQTVPAGGSRCHVATRYGLS